MGKKFEIKGDDISDGFHTFTELYNHRIALFLALACRVNWPQFYKKDYEDWFCWYMETPWGQISYHLPNKFLSIAEALAEHDPDHKWDGHDSDTVVKRLTLSTRHPKRTSDDRKNKLLKSVLEYFEYDLSAEKFAFFLGAIATLKEEGEKKADVYPVLLVDSNFEISKDLSDFTGSVLKKYLDTIPQLENENKKERKTKE